MTRARCRSCGRIVCSTACAAVWLTLGTVFADGARAQAGDSRTPPVSTRTSVEIGGMFLTAPTQPMLAALPAGTECNSEECYGGQITVRANQRWQLQVRLDPAIQLPAAVAWRPPVASATNQPLDATWLTILSGPIPTAGTDVTLQFAVAPTGRAAPSGEPFVQLLSMAVQYRVIELP